MKISNNRFTIWMIQCGLSVIIMAMISSCVTTKKTTYLQEFDQTTIFPADSADHIYRVQANDNLYIRVITPDPRWATMFNTLPVSAPTMSVGEHSLDLISYTVRQDGMVTIPYMGPIQVAGKTIPEIEEILGDALADYVTDADITVKIVNNYVSIIGDVNVPGRYPVFKEQMNIFQALAMAGDVSEYGDRLNIQVIRQTSEGTVVKKFNLTDRDIIDTEYFYIMPNDVIYVQPMKGKFFQMNSFPYAIILSTVTTFILLLNIVRSN